MACDTESKRAPGPFHYPPPTSCTFQLSSAAHPLEVHLLSRYIQSEKPKPADQGVIAYVPRTYSLPLSTPQPYIPACPIDLPSHRSSGWFRAGWFRVGWFG